MVKAPKWFAGFAYYALLALSAGFPFYSHAAPGVRISSQSLSQFKVVSSYPKLVCWGPKAKIGKISTSRLKAGSVWTALKVAALRKQLERRLNEQRRLGPNPIPIPRTEYRNLRRQLKSLEQAEKRCSAFSERWHPTTPAPTASPSHTPPNEMTPTPPQPSAAPTTPSPEPTASPTPTPTLRPTLPPGIIMNPYWTTPAWRLWTENTDPVFADIYQRNVWPLPAPIGTRAYAVITPSARVYPNLSASTPYPGQFLAQSSTLGATSGYWDDVYTTLDNGHTGMPGSWSAAGTSASINITGQFVNVDSGVASDSLMLELGTNFTSQSLSNQGHHVTCSSYSAPYLEQWGLFANAVRAVPGYLSYQDKWADRTIDSFDGIFSYRYHSLGRSGSEVRAIQKMLIAGGYLPRTVKDLLKKSGAYSSALLYIFKASLPYLDAQGNRIPYEHELRHRSVYASAGNNISSEFAPYNATYHGYDEGLHMYYITQLAASMQVAPPVALFRLLSVSITRDGEAFVTDATPDAQGNWYGSFENASRWIATSSKTTLRIRGLAAQDQKASETIILRVDVQDSYDLQYLPLTFKWTALYPQQSNITIEREGNTSVYRITAHYQPQLERKRMPILLTVNNGFYDSNPAIVNFYWPASNTYDCPGYYSAGADPNPSEVNYYPHPILSITPSGDISVSRGQTASFTVNCTDTEGFPTTLYRWEGDVGQISSNQFSFTTNAGTPLKIYPVHLICSNGVGGYNSLTVNITVTA